MKIQISSFRWDDQKQLLIKKNSYQVENIRYKVIKKIKTKYNEKTSSKENYETLFECSTKFDNFLITFRKINFL